MLTSNPLSSSPREIVRKSFDNDNNKDKVEPPPWRDESEDQATQYRILRLPILDVTPIALQPVYARNAGRAVVTDAGFQTEWLSQKPNEGAAFLGSANPRRSVTSSSAVAKARSMDLSMVVCVRTSQRHFCLPKDSCQKSKLKYVACLWIEAIGAATQILE
ncbi:hypothetical protein EJ03DRAFT_339630 [Teratosphaeria nubilosa]|uniref:Uncharacterized protein n=1 Tax=Teratosphaeria nubilosa TaxID=161662 RepID=A0A6G1KVI3_9PEZI|nr:hypothetical protein EJ03DRAFT_339630 [Teratosphaeria nubilosa]